jgi:hypothetical protein
MGPPTSDEARGANASQVEGKADNAILAHDVVDDEHRRVYYGVCAARGGFYWFTQPRGGDAEVVADGFADTREQALQAAEQAMQARGAAGSVPVLSSAKRALHFFQQRHAKLTRFRSDWRQRFPFWAERTHLFIGSSFPVPIVSVTDRWVYVQRDLHGAAMASPDRVARRDCHALPRLVLETRGWVWHGWRCYSVEEPEPVHEADVAAAAAAEVAELRKQVQRTHPDKGGNPAAFREAMSALDRARGRT